MKRFFYFFLIIFFSSSSTFAEIALECSLQKQCTIIGDLGCKTFEKDTDKTLVIIKDDLLGVSISKENIFNGDYIITINTKTQLNGFKVSHLSKSDLVLLRDTFNKRKKEEITQKEFEEIVYLRIFFGVLEEFYLDRYLLDLKLKLVDAYPPKKTDRVVRDFKCNKIEKAL